VSALAAQLARAIDLALAHLERNRISEAQVVLHDAQEAAEVLGLRDLSAQDLRQLGALPTVTPPRVPVSQTDEE
jgi:hypothetical protein